MHKNNDETTTLGTNNLYQKGHLLLWMLQPWTPISDLQALPLIKLDSGSTSQSTAFPRGQRASQGPASLKHQ